MKNIIVILLLGFYAFPAIAQKLIPEITIKDLNGKSVNTTQFNQEKETVVICFFASWCKPCTIELNAIAEEYEDWQEDSNFRMIAISVDDSKSNAKLKSLVNGNDWPFEVYSDSNSALKRALNVSAIPHALIVNANNEVVYEKSSYTVGSEFELYKKFKELKSK